MKPRIKWRRMESGNMCCTLSVPIVQRGKPTQTALYIGCAPTVDEAYQVCMQHAMENHRALIK